MPVVEVGVFLLVLELSATVWVVGGWTSLIALRCRLIYRAKREGRGLLVCLVGWLVSSQVVGVAALLPHLFRFPFFSCALEKLCET